MGKYVRATIIRNKWQILSDMIYEKKTNKGPTKSSSSYEGWANKYCRKTSRISLKETIWNLDIDVIPSSLILERTLQFCLTVYQWKTSQF